MVREVCGWRDRFHPHEQKESAPNRRLTLRQEEVAVIYAFISIIPLSLTAIGPRSMPLESKCVPN